MNEFARVGFNYGSYYYAYILKWKLLSQDKINNNSKIRLQASIYVGANYISWSSGSASLHGTSFNLATTYNSGETVVYTKDITVNHDSNGKASVYVSGSINTTFLMSGNCGGTINLPIIDRSAPNVSISINEITEKSVMFSYSSNSSYDEVEARLNNDNWFKISSSPATIDNLIEDTNYALQVRVRKTSNHVWGTSGSISFKTIAGTFAAVSIKGSTFIQAETYLITTKSVEKLTKDQYKSIVG